MLQECGAALERVVLLLIDNYDSFTHNLWQLFGSLGADVRVVRNDAITLAEVRSLAPRGILLSPGPGTPLDSGVCMDVLDAMLGELPILGVCLGHQCLAASLGARITRAREPLHGRSTPVEHDGLDLFDAVPSPCLVGRYHSLIVDESSLPACLQVTARSSSGEIMGLADRARRAFGVQFHPESFLTEGGARMAANFLALVDG